MHQTLLQHLQVLSPFVVKRTAFTNKAFCNTEISTAVKIVGVSNNSFGLAENPTTAQLEDFSPSLVTPQQPSPPLIKQVTKSPLQMQKWWYLQVVD